MGKQVYLGVDGIARKVKKIYLGVGGVARKVKKGYMGVGGVARPFFGGGELVYYGTAEALSVARAGLAAATVGGYGLFGGGSYGQWDHSNAVDAYDTAMTRTSPEPLSVARSALAAATVGGYALFGGGESLRIMVSGSNTVKYMSTINDVNAYDSALTQTKPTALSAFRRALAAVGVGSYALFGGGESITNSISPPQVTPTYTVKNTVDAYDASLTRTTPTTLSTARQELAAAAVGGYGLFGGGYTTKSHSNVVDAYDASLTHTSPAGIAVARNNLAAAAVGKYALFGGGTQGGYSAYVDVYDASLTRTALEPLSSARAHLAAVAVDGYVLFGGGSGGLSVVDVYDASLTHTLSTPLSAGRDELAAVTVGNYALFGGGGSYSDVVDVYTVE